MAVAPPGVMVMKHPRKQIFCDRFCWVLTLGLLLAATLPSRATPVIDTSSPISFFTNTANLFLQTAGYDFTVANIPIYPTNYYTPAVHRLLQLAANIYDATTNKTSPPPNDFDYPSVFRPLFIMNETTTSTNVSIPGYHEETNNFNINWHMRLRHR